MNTIQVRDIRTDVDAWQPRLDRLSLEHVNRLVNSDPESWPPILVRPYEGVFTVLDGFHRVEAARRLKLTSLTAVVFEGDDSAARETAFEHNKAHGLPLTLADRKAHARWLHEHYPELSNRTLGVKCGLSHTTIKAALDSGQSDQYDDRSSREQAKAVDRLLVLLLKVHQEATSWFGRHTPKARVEAFYQALDRYSEDAQRLLAETCQAALEAIQQYRERGERDD